MSLLVATFNYNYGTGTITFSGIQFQYTSSGAGLYVYTAVNTVTTIPLNCFNANAYLVSIYIPNNVTSILNHAFNKCYNLQTANIPSGITTIETYTFAECFLLTLTIPTSVNTIKNQAFLSCRNLNTTIPQSVTYIGDEAFYGCYILPQVTIYSTITYLGSGAFADCRAFLTITTPNNMTTIDTYAFSGCSNVTTITLPNVTTIKQGVFEGCSRLTTINMPVCNSIGGAAFRSCTDLQSIYNNAVTFIGNQAFQNISSLEYVSFPNATTIQYSCFQASYNIKKLTLPYNSTIGSDIINNSAQTTVYIRVPYNLRNMDPNTMSTYTYFKTNKNDIVKVLQLYNIPITNIFINYLSIIGSSNNITIEFTPIDIINYSDTIVIKYSIDNGNTWINGVYVIVNNTITNIPIVLEYSLTSYSLLIKAYSINDVVPSTYYGPETVNTYILLDNVAVKHIRTVGTINYVTITFTPIEIINDSDNVLMQYSIDNGNTWITGVYESIDHMITEAYFVLEYSPTPYKLLLRNYSLNINLPNRYLGEVYIITTQNHLLSNICFLEKTPINTDQGIIHIEKINPGIHTIDNKSIVAITKTVSEDNYLICFEKNALGRSIPSENTKITREHKVYYNGNEMKAESFLGKGYRVYKVKYSGEVLYNVLMETHHKMVVNNLVCETLHPENLIAKIYRELPLINQKFMENIIENANKYHNSIEHKKFRIRNILEPRR